MSSDGLAGRRAILCAGRLIILLAALAGSGGCAVKPKPALHRVTIRLFKFEPAALAVAAGDTVEWTNRDIVPHTSTAESGRWDSKTILPNGSWRAVMTTRGAEAYVCQLHPTMKGQIEVN